ncbi:MAG: DNA repair protein RecO [Crocinitomicaceae bacterium]|nr:DNA repair protein RecO [Flavobacteriales bacterium]NQZ36649.1 DNA repair protein RecO [Crocinitomicaceae bacterium]
MKSTDLGIFLHRISYSNTSLIISFYTQKSGLKKFIFKGGKKKAHNLFPMALSELSYYDRKESDLLQLTAADPAFPTDFQFDPIKGTIAFFMAEVIRKVVHVNEQDLAMFRFLENAVHTLNDSSESHLIPVFFMIDLAEWLGVQPFIENEAYEHFNLDEGRYEGVVRNQFTVVSGEVADVIKSHILGKEINQLSKQQRVAALEVMIDYFRIHVPGFGHIDAYEIIKEVLA